MRYTHKKLTYFAHCVQWKGDNANEILEIYPNASIEGEYVVIRTPGRLDTLYVSDWLRVGQNGVIKRFTDREFQEKYESLNVREFDPYPDNSADS